MLDELWLCPLAFEYFLTVYFKGFSKNNEAIPLWVAEVNVILYPRICNGIGLFLPHVPGALPISVLTSKGIFSPHLIYAEWWIGCPL